MILDENEIISNEKEDNKNYLRYKKFLGICVFINGGTLTVLALLYLLQEFKYFSEIDLFITIPFFYIGFICFSLLFSGYQLFTANGNQKKVNSGIIWLIFVWVLIILTFIISFLGINIF